LVTSPALGNTIKPSCGFVPPAVSLR
jgi:hypothetical protein